MLRALLWKEWRGQRPVVAAGFGLSLLLPLLIFFIVRGVDGRVVVVEYAQLVAFLMAALVWPLFAAATAVTAHAESSDAASLGYLLSRPVARTRLWAVKVASAAGALALVIGFSFGVAQFIHVINLADTLDFPFVADSMSTGLSSAAVQVLVVGGVGLVFAGALTCSLLTRQALAAVMGGFAVAMAMEFGALTVASALAAQAGQPEGIETFLQVFIVATMVALLAAACFLFVGGAGVRGVRSGPRIAVAVAGVLLAMLGGTVAGARAATAIDPETARSTGFVAAIPGHSAALVWLAGSRFAGDSYWVIGSDEPLRRVTPRMVTRAAPTPDGEWIVYETRRGALGIRRAGCDLRRVRFDGSEDRSIHETFCSSRPLVFSSDGRRVAVELSAGRMFVIAIDGSSPGRPYDAVTGRAGEPARPIRWISRDREILVESRRGLYAVDVASGAVREILVDDRIRRVVVRAATDAQVYAFLSLRRTRADAGSGGDRGGERYVLLDIVSGAVEELYAGCLDHTAYSAFSTDGTRFYYAVCPNDYSSLTPLRVRHLDSGEDTELALIEGRILSVWPSPEGGRVMVWTFTGDDPDQWGESRLVSVDRNGGVEQIPGTLRRAWERAGHGPVPPPWGFGGWLDEDTVALERAWSRSGVGAGYQLAYFDLGGPEPVILLEGRTQWP